MCGTLYVYMRITFKRRCTNLPINYISPLKNRNNIYNPPYINSKIVNPLLANCWKPTLGASYYQYLRSINVAILFSRQRQIVQMHLSHFPRPFLQELARLSAFPPISSPAPNRDTCFSPTSIGRPPVSFSSAGSSGAGASFCTSANFNRTPM